MHAFTPGLMALMLGSTVQAATMTHDHAADELIRLDADFQRAVGAKDADAVAKFLTDDFILITGSSRILTKQELLKEVASATLKWELNASREVRVRIHGDAAVVTALLDQKGMDNNEPFDSPVRYTDTWIRENGTWRQISGHASPVKQK
jgi:ketosteroid isomerase-like protein